MTETQNRSSSVPRQRFLASHLGLIKWAAMVAALGWFLIYRLSEQAAHIPEFVYVNF